MRIIEDSLDLKTVPYGYKEEDDNPTIAEVTYDDDKLKIMEEFEAGKKWKKMVDKPSESSWPHRPQDGKESPRRVGHDSPSPPRRGKNDSVTQRRVRHDSGSLTPPRRVKNDSSPPRKVRHGFDSPRARSDSDDSPPRRPRYSGSPPNKTKHDSDSSPIGGRHDSESPPRRPNFEPSKCNSSPPRRVRHDSESPPRRTRHDSGSPPWKMRHESTTPPLDKKTDSLKKTKNYSHSPHIRNPSPPLPSGRMRRDSDSSLTDEEKKNVILPSDMPQRQSRHDSSSSSPPPRKKRHDSGNSLPRRHDSDPSSGSRKLSSKISSKRNKQTSNSRELEYSDGSHSDSSDSSPGKCNTAYSPPPRKSSKETKFGPSKRKQEVKAAAARAGELGPHTSPRRKQYEADVSPPRRKRHDSDSSPPRKKKFSSDSSPHGAKRYDSDTSPPRQKRRDPDSSPLRKRHDSDSSPPRKKKLTSDSSPRQKRYDSDASPPRQKRHDSDSSPVRKKRHSDSDPSPPRIKKGKAGFVSPSRRKGGDGQSEGGQLRPERKMTTQEFLSARKHGRLKKDTPEELARKEREAVLQQQAEEKHQQWKHGVKQVQDYKKKVASDIHEMGKAFTRTADDVDMNVHLKMVARKEDPMLEYVTKKDTKGNKVAVKPVYKGSFPPNRLDIRPGYRWDGVDRSSGFEKRWFEHQNNKRAHNEDAYKWSVSDM